MPRTRLILTAILLLCTTTYLYHSHPFLIPLSWPEAHVENTLPPANSTLGFGTIIAVSPAHSPRRASLLWAANLTSISIEIPALPEWSTSDLEDFKAKEGSTISIGSAKAWLGHLNALRSFLSNPSHPQTALILEDDTDFSLFLRNIQIPRLASSLHTLLNTTPSSSSKNTYWPPSFSSESNPFLKWHILYPGHCDDLPSPAYLSAPNLTYHDPSTPPNPLLHPDTALFLASLNFPSQTRVVHRAYWPLCTFAYAVTRASATLILESFSTEPRGGSWAFDVALLGACRDWEEWRCWSVAPELFHHVIGESEIGRADKGEDKEEEEVLGERKKSRRGTWNLGCGARHVQLWVEEEDVRMRGVVKGVVERAVKRGECPVDGVREERGWNGCEWGGCGAQS